jgi:hypothetical protein
LPAVSFNGRDIHDPAPKPIDMFAVTLEGKRLIVDIR